MNAQQHCPQPDVLVVEDEARLRELLLSAIPDMGFSVRGARSGEDALNMMASRPAGIVILDLNLPGMNGLEFFDLLHERWPGTRVVIMTGFGDLAAAQKAIRLGVADFLTKPASLGDLEAALELARRGCSAPTPAPVASVPPEPPEGGGTPASSMRLEEVERLHILAVLDRNSGNRAATAAELGISVRTLYYRLAEFQRQGLLP